MIILNNCSFSFTFLYKSILNTFEFYYLAKSFKKNQFEIYGHCHAEYNKLRKEMIKSGFDYDK